MSHTNAHTGGVLVGGTKTKENTPFSDLLKPAGNPIGSKTYPFSIRVQQLASGCIVDTLFRRLVLYPLSYGRVESDSKAFPAANPVPAHTLGHTRTTKLAGIPKTEDRLQDALSLSRATSADSSLPCAPENALPFSKESEGL